MAAAYSQVLVDDRLRDSSSVLFAVFGQLGLVFAFGIGGFVIPADTLFTSLTCVRVFMHLSLGLLLIRLYTRLESPPPLLPTCVDTGPTLWGLAHSGVPGAFAAFISTILHGIFWQLQALFSVYLSFTSDVSTEVANGLQAGLNFGMHGAGITIFCMVLALHNRPSFPFLRIAVVLGAFGGAFMSVQCILHVWDLRDEGSSSLVTIPVLFFFARAVVGCILGVYYNRLALPPVAREAAHRTVANLDWAASHPIFSQVTCWGFMFSIVVYAYNVARILRVAGVRTGFGIGEIDARAAIMAILFDDGLAINVVDGTDAGHAQVAVPFLADSPWHNYRLVEFPAGYGVVFHFTFLLLGFGTHWLFHAFHPSKWISLAFTASALLIFAAEAVAVSADSLSLTVLSCVFASACSGSLLVLFWKQWGETTGVKDSSGSPPKSTADVEAASTVLLPRSNVGNLGDFWH